jgi:hypothetical protein
MVLFTIPVMVTLCFLFILSAVDLKYKQIPSIVSWAFILIILFLQGPSAVYGGTVMLILGLLLMDFSTTQGFFEGGADLKVLIAIGMSLPGTLTLLIFIPILLFAGLLYKVALKYGLRKRGKDEIAFIPVFLVAYIILLCGVHYFL